MPSSRLPGDRVTSNKPQPQLILDRRGGIFKMPFSDLEDRLEGIENDVKKLSHLVQLYSTTAVADAMFGLIKSGSLGGSSHHGGQHPHDERPSSPPWQAGPHDLQPVHAPTVTIEESSDGEDEDYSMHDHKVTFCPARQAAMASLRDTRVCRGTA